MYLMSDIMSYYYWDYYFIAILSPFEVYTEKYHSTAKKSENTMVALDRTGYIEKVESLLLSWYIFDGWT